eukprot:gnl/TRDRNA2_/TRDRNA2_80220_c0_seq1.p1 gnl/TRDRNA2_/TRDRNA2_80220_c0~~gnl/TRDRNA2_/TRDRNA2_80220_c0_seq1.p1  ORF type:complete len:471 (-),score=51.01 gnl/TRDRNA2_/TRDRNA2_80220_c0_seq1:57-1442(-)
MPDYAVLEDSGEDEVVVGFRTAGPRRRVLAMSCCGLLSLMFMAMFCYLSPGNGEVVDLVGIGMPRPSFRPGSRSSLQNGHLGGGSLFWPPRRSTAPKAKFVPGPDDRRDPKDGGIPQWKPPTPNDEETNPKAGQYPGWNITMVESQSEIEQFFNGSVPSPPRYMPERRGSFVIREDELPTASPDAMPYWRPDWNNEGRWREDSWVWPFRNPPPRSHLQFVGQENKKIMNPVGNQYTDPPVPRFGLRGAPLETCTTRKGENDYDWQRTWGPAMRYPTASGHCNIIHQICVKMSEEFLEGLYPTYDLHGLHDDRDIAEPGELWCLDVFAWAKAAVEDPENVEGLEVECDRTEAHARDVFKNFLWLHEDEDGDPHPNTWKDRREAVAGLERLDKECGPDARPEVKPNYYREGFGSTKGTPFETPEFGQFDDLFLMNEEKRRFIGRDVYEEATDKAEWDIGTDTP